MAVAKHSSGETTNQNCAPMSASGSNNNQLAQHCCAGCQMPIKDRFIFSVIEQNFHQDCVRCFDCSSNLNERCYTFDGKLYCRVDYWRRFGPKCSACQEPIKPTELVQRLKENLVYHLNCFVCQDCKRHLQAGEQLHLIDDKRLLCKRDFMTISSALSSTCAPNSANHANQLISSNQQVAADKTVPAASKQQLSQQQARSNQENDAALADTLSSASNASNELNNPNDLDPLDELEELDEEGVAGGGEGPLHYAGQYAPELAGLCGAAGKGEERLKGGALSADCGDDLVDANGKRRGPRTTIKPKQLDTLRRAFETASKPTRHIREQLAAETGLNMRVIQVWFQNRRSKERRMKNSNGSVRRNFFRSSSRRLRVGPASGTPTGANGAGGPQQSLMASRQAIKREQQQLSPMEASEQLLSQQQQQQQGRQHNSPSEFGGSSSGGFTYFSDSSNQGDAFAINTSGHQQQPPQQQQQQQPNQAQPQPQYSISGNCPPDQTTLMALESPSGGANQPPGAGQQQQMNLSGQQTVAARSQQQQYALQSMKNTPPPPPPIYQGGQHPHAQSQPQAHMIIGGPAPPPIGHSHQHAHLAGGQMLQPNPGMGINALLSHPQGPSVVQW